MLQSVAIGEKTLDAYRPVIGPTRVDEILQAARPLRGARVLHLNATGYGGGVAELLHSLVPLMRAVGIDAEWKVMIGAPELWDVTKAMHNLLQGATIANAPIPSALPDGSTARNRAAQIISAPWDDRMMEVWRHYNKLTSAALVDDYDFVVVHDPQPAGVARYWIDGHAASSRRRWIWRAHIDLTRAEPAAWDFLHPYLAVYDGAIFTIQGYVKPDVPIPLVALIPPAIDPLSPKNAPLAPDRARAILRRYDVDPDRPLVSQISRFDPWKDPLGVIDVYRRVKRDVPELQLALIGSMASDDPEGWRYYELSLRYAGMDTDIHVLTNFQGVGNVEVNAFQRESDVVLQKSLREGFALTVSEALWKGRPVVATDVGGIPLQIASGQTGYLVHATDQAAERVGELLAHPHRAEAQGLAGRERVRENFLTTRLLMDYLQLFNQLAPRSEASLASREAAVPAG